MSEADEGGGEGVYDEGGSGVSKKKFIIIGLALLFGLGGLGIFLERGHLFPHNLHGRRAVADAAVDDEKTALVEVGPLVSNLSSGVIGPDERSVYVKTTVKVEVSASCQASVTARRAVIEDSLQGYLHETRREDIGGDGLYRLREALLRRLRVSFAPCNVRNVYFVDFLIQ